MGNTKHGDRIQTQLSTQMNKIINFKL